MTRKIVGLTIDDDAITLVTCSVIHRTLTFLNHHTIEPLSHDNIRDNSEEVVDRLQQMKSDGLFQGAELIINLPESKPATRILTFPFTEKRKIDAAVPFSMEDYLAYPVEEAHFITSTISRKNKENKVLCWGFKKEELRLWLDIFARAGLEPKALYPDVLAYSAVIGEREEVTAFLVINWKKSFLFLKEGKAVLQSRLLGVGMSDFLSEIANNSGKEYDEIVEIISQISSENELSELKSFLLPGIKVLNKEINFSLKSLVRLAAVDEVNTIEIISNPYISKVVLSLLENNTASSITSMKFNHPLASGIDKLKKSSSDIVQAMGLVILGVDRALSNGCNLRRNEFVYQKDISALKGRLIGTAILIFLSIFLGISTLYSQVSSMEGIFNQKKAELNSMFKKAFPKLRNVGKEVVLAKQKVKDLKEEMKNFGQYSNNHPSTLTILKDISSVIPKNIIIDVQECSITYSKIELKGEIDTFKSVDQVRSKINKLPYIKEVKTGKTTKGVTDRNLIFQMTASFLNGDKHE